MISRRFVVWTGPTWGTLLLMQLMKPQGGPYLTLPYLPARSWLVQLGWAKPCSPSLLPAPPGGPPHPQEQLGACVSFPGLL